MIETKKQPKTLKTNLENLPEEIQKNIAFDDEFWRENFSREKSEKNADFLMQKTFSKYGFELKYDNFRYQYCLNNPLKYIDPDGRSPISNYVPSFKSIFREAWLLDYGRSPEQSVAKVQTDIIYSEPVQFTGSVGRAMNLMYALELRQMAYKGDKIGDTFAHQKAAWDYGNYVGNPNVALTFRSMSEFAFQFPVFTIDDMLSRVISGEPGDYQPWSLDGPGGIRDSFYDIENTVHGALGDPINLGGELYDGE